MLEGIDCADWFINGNERSWCMMCGRIDWQYVCWASLLWVSPNDASCSLAVMVIVVFKSGRVKTNDI